MGNFLSKPVEVDDAVEEPVAPKGKTRQRKLRRRGTARRVKKQEEELRDGD